MSELPLVRRLFNRRVIASLALVGSFALGACKEEDTGPGKLFDEDGVFEVTFFSLDGAGLRMINTTNRAEAFLIKFDATENVVQTAMCGEDADDTPENSLCRLSPTGTQWNCNCYGYAFEESTMVWREFNAGDTPPEVVIGEVAEPMMGDTDTDTDGGGGDDGSAAGGDPMLNVGEVANIAATYTIGPLPMGIFGSDGNASLYQIQKKAPTKFDQVFADPDGRPVCSPCI